MWSYFSKSHVPYHLRTITTLLYHIIDQGRASVYDWFSIIEKDTSKIFQRSLVLSRETEYIDILESD